MDFTPLIPCGSVPSTTCDTFIATVFLPLRLIIRSTNSLSIKRVINLDASFGSGINHVLWSKSSTNGHRYLLVADCKQVAIYDMDDDELYVHISEGLGGVRQVEWSAAGDEVLVWADFQLKLTVWNIRSSSGSIIPNPKFSQKGISYRPGSQSNQAALLQRTSHDNLAILDTTSSDWRVVKTFTLATTDAQGVQWSPDGKWIAVWDNMIDYRVLIHTPDGRLIRTFIAYDIGLGVKSVTWSPTSEYLAIGSFDNKVRLLNNKTFSPSIELSHVPTVRSQGTLVWRQISHGQTSRYEIADQPISPPYVKDAVGDDVPRHGVGLVSFSPNGYFLVSRCESMPTTLWLWSLRELSPVAILVNSHPIKAVRWLPDEIGSLVFTCQGPTVSDNNALYLWNIEWSSPRIIMVPRDGFEVKWFHLIRDEEEEIPGIMIGSGDSFTIGYSIPEEIERNQTIREEDEEEEEFKMKSQRENGLENASMALQTKGMDLQGSVIIHGEAIHGAGFEVGRPMAVL